MTALRWVLLVTVVLVGCLRAAVLIAREDRNGAMLWLAGTFLVGCVIARSAMEAGA